MFAKLKAGYAVFTKGQQVADPALWKTHQITAGMIAGLLAAIVALARTFGYELPLTDDQIMQIGGAVVAVLGLFNAGATVATTTKIGLPAIEPGPSKPVVPAVAEKPASPMQRVRRAANGDIINSSDRNDP